MVTCSLDVFEEERNENEKGKSQKTICIRKETRK